ncbi:hypothetical protein VTL71DRAFT_10519 [Oculimacula yallundae]|uniref:Uncharacterized protein n=1 Tax=Oculimacula yallundae TaxID=86028 RepID=A0ABR4CTL5_9HELO
MLHFEPLASNLFRRASGTTPRDSSNKQFNHTTLQDAFPSSSPRHLFHGLHGRLSPRLFNNPSSALVTIPLPRGSPIQYPIQPIDKVVCSQILDFHGRRIRYSFRARGLADIQEPVEG